MQQNWNPLEDFRSKIRQEENAIAHQIKKYKNNFVGKPSSSINVDNFVRFTKELKILIVSHCKNTFLVAPENNLVQVEELSLLLDDLIDKYYTLFQRFNEKMKQINTQDPRSGLATQLCSVCAQQLKKVEIERIRHQLIPYCDLKQDKGDNFDGVENQEEDYQFFAEINNLLTNKQNELIRNQIQINKYQEIITTSLNSFLSAQKGLFQKQKTVLPNKDWLPQAQQEMKTVLKQTFDDKIPPWIQKMFDFFLKIYLRSKVLKQADTGVQTQQSANAQLIELKKKLVMSKTKIESFQSQKKLKQRQYYVVTNENKLLQEKVNFYKRQMENLLQEIDNLKTQNQIIMMKLRNSTLRNRTKDKSENDENLGRNGSRSSIRDISKSNKSILRKSHYATTSESKILPKINQSTISKRDSKDHRTSIKLQPSLLQRSIRRQGKKKTVQMLKQSNFGKKYHQEEEDSSKNDVNNFNAMAESISRTISKDISKQSLESGEGEGEKRGGKYETVIEQNEEINVDNVDDEKMKVQQVNNKLQAAIKESLSQKNDSKHIFNATTPQMSLKKVARATFKPDNPSQIQTRQSRDQTLRTFNPSEQGQSYMLSTWSKVYNQLTAKGHLVKLSEEQFKSIIKIKALNLSPDVPSNVPSRIDHRTRHTLDQNYFGEKKQQKDLRHQMMTTSRKEWNRSNYHPQRTMTVRPSLHQYKKSYEKDYFKVFTSEQNAYNYEASLTKNHTRGVYKMSKNQQQLCEQLFKKLTQIKTQDSEHYRFLCSFLKHPFQMMQHNIEVTYNNDMKFSSFEHYIERLMSIHNKCKKNEGICQHLIEFKKKIFENSITSLPRA